MAATPIPDSIFWSVIAAALALVALVLLFREWFTWWTTEIAVTNRRVIYKVGFISRKTIEMHMDKIESVRRGAIDPGTHPELWNSDGARNRVGRVLKHFKNIIAAPIELRNHITGI